MRSQVSNPDVKLLKYAIREIVDVAQKLSELDSDFNLISENIGDPIAKGWTVPPFLKEILCNEINKQGDKVFGYSHSRGLPMARKWVVEYSKRFAPSSTLDYEYVLFVNGLGAGISILYQMLPQGKRILQPNPGYPAHASMEAFAAKKDSIFYNLDPNNGWEPDLAHMESQIKEHPEVVGILVVNPNNPTGGVLSAETIEKIVKLAEKYNLMIISDEVYFRMVYNGHKYSHITEMGHGRVPLIVMRGISKDVPWPGGRCGWLEFHNTELDPDFLAYCEAMKQRVLMEVCAGTLPQSILPQIYDHPDYLEWNKNYNNELEKNGNYIADVLSKTKGLTANRINGAFYMMPLFKEGVLNDKQTLPIKNEAVKKYIEEKANKPGVPLDQRFTYYLLAATGICVVPASGFSSPYPGFRLTTLDRDDKRRKETYSRLSSAVEEYISK